MKQVGEICLALLFLVTLAACSYAESGKESREDAGMKDIGRVQDA